MDINFLGQGFEEKSINSVGNLLIKFFADKNFHTFTGISAFTSQAGIFGLSKHIKTAKKHFNLITIITGVDQKGTSKEALEELLSLNINAFVFYQPSITIFHPKIYLFEGNERYELIIGSSNMTSQGLFTNVEASIHVSMNKHSSSDRKIVEQLKEYFKGLFNQTDPNLKRLDRKLIDNLVRAKVVPTEEERKAIQDKTKKIQKNETENILSKIFPKRAIAKIPSEFRGIRKKAAPISSTSTNTTDSISRIGDLVWISGKLTERDLNIPKGSNTNPTGSMLFKKGKMEGVDQRHYFREIVFSALKWKRDTKPETAHLERAIANFNILIDGKNEGVFKLTITHNTKTDTRSYEQKNSMTQISWGDAKKVIAKDTLIGKSARLFKTMKSNEFILKID